MNQARNVSRYNNRIPVVARIPTLPTPQSQNNSDMPVLASRPNPSPNIRRIFADNHNRQAQHPRLDPEEASFEQYFSELFTKCAFSLVKTLIVCLILMILTQIMDTTTTLGIGAAILVSANLLHGIFFLTAIRFEKTVQDKLRMFIRGLQCVPLIIFLLSVGIIHNNTMNNISAALYIVLYAIITGDDFLAPEFIHVYITKIKKVVLLMKILVILQLILILVQRNLSNPITWFAAFFPLYILILVLLSCTIILIKKAFITHRTQFWITEVYHKKEAIVWILANLVGLQAILLYGTIHASFILDDDPSNYTGPFLPLCIIINLSCLASLFFVLRVHEGIPKVFKTLASLPATVANHVPQELYVIKISNTYFKMAMKRDINQLKSQKESAKSGDSEVEAGLKRMATEMGMCMICCKGVSDGVFMWCGHGGICFECGKEILKVKNECHMCREKIWSVLKMEINAKEVYYKVLEEIKCESF